MKTLLIEDEERSLTLLRNQVKRYCPQLDVVAESHTIEQGSELLRLHQPDLVFLDICFGNRLVFELLDQLDFSDFRIIFVTAYDEFAIKAFQYNAVHYILKPIEPGKLVEAVNRAVSGPASMPNGLQRMLDKLGVRKASQRLAIPSVSKITYLHPEEIIRLESDGAYTVIHLSSGEHLVSTRPLREYDKLLSSCGYCRVHRSHLINLDKVREYTRVPKERVTLSDGSSVEVSRKRRAQFLSAIAGR